MLHPTALPKHLAPVLESVLLLACCCLFVHRPQASYLEGRFKMAERDRYRSNRRTGDAAALPSPSAADGPAGQGEDAAAAADAAMASLLQEEAALAAAQEAAAEKKKAKKKAKKEKTKKGELRL